MLADYCDVFISCLVSHSDGTHSLQRIKLLNLKQTQYNTIQIHEGEQIIKLTFLYVHYAFKWKKGNLSLAQLCLNILPSPFSRGSQNLEKFRAACLNENLTRFLTVHFSIFSILVLPNLCLHKASEQPKHFLLVHEHLLHHKTATITAVCCDRLG